MIHHANTGKAEAGMAVANEVRSKTGARGRKRASS